MSRYPEHFDELQRRYPAYVDALQTLGATVGESGPLDGKVCQLIQLAAAAATRSEGAVHSHARRALEAGASVEELHQTLLLLTSTVGFPTVSAAMSWVDDLLPEA